MRLIESSAPRRRARGGTALSVVVHVALIGGAVAATSHAGTRDADGARETTVYYAPPPPAPSPVPPTAAPPASPSAPAAPAVPVAPLVAPTVTPVDLPPVPTAPALDPTAGLTETFTHRVAVSTVPAGGVPGGVGSGEPLEAHVVERVATLVAPVTPRYPEPLRATGVEGRSALRFVVDTAGRVERGTVRVVDATHPAFGEAARAAVAAMRFRPAEVGGRPVRQLVELPFEFRLR